jgi:hypothetical protein
MSQGEHLPRKTWAVWLASRIQSFSLGAPRKWGRWATVSRTAPTHNYSENNRGEEKEKRRTQNATSFERHQHEVRKRTPSSQQIPEKFRHHSLLFSAILATTRQVPKLAINASIMTGFDSRLLLLDLLLTPATPLQRRLSWPSRANGKIYNHLLTSKCNKPC